MTRPLADAMLSESSLPACSRSVSSWAHVFRWTRRRLDDVISPHAASVEYVSAHPAADAAEYFQALLLDDGPMVTKLFDDAGKSFRARTSSARVGRADVQRYESAFFALHEEQAHWALLVGWGRFDVENEHADYWLAKTSWGHAWGDRGYVWIEAFSWSMGLTYLAGEATFDLFLPGPAFQVSVSRCARSSPQGRGSGDVFARAQTATEQYEEQSDSDESCPMGEEEPQPSLMPQN